MREGFHERTTSDPDPVVGFAESAPVETVLWWPGGRWLLSGTRNGAVTVMDSESGKILQQFSAHKEPVFGVVVSRDARTVATSSRDGTIKLWDAR